MFQLHLVRRLLGLEMGAPRLPDLSSARPPNPPTLVSGQLPYSQLIQIQTLQASISRPAG